MVQNPPQTLASLRETSGLTLYQIVEQAREVDAEFPTTHAGYLGIEEHGTRDYWKIKALSQVFKVDTERLADMLKPQPRPKK